MARTYYTLVTRDSASRPWGAAFGDYDRSVVSEERMEYQHAGYDNRNLRIIKSGETNDEIDEAVALLNGGNWHADLADD